MSTLGRVLRGMVRGGILGAVMGTIAGVATLLVFGLWIQTPMLARPLPVRAAVVVIFMASLVIPTTIVGAIGFGLSAFLSRAKASQPADSDSQRGAK